MSQSDKTRQKLVDSMRKTKSGATGKSEPAAKDQQTSVEAEASKPQATKAAPATRAKPAAKRSERKTAVENQTDSYQSARRRVWPD